MKTSSGVARDAALAVLAPIAWGTTYVMTTELLPDGRPLLVAALRVAPAALVLLLAGARSPGWRPQGAAWWRAGLLALFNFGLFFPLLVGAVYRLPGGVAAAVGGVQPLLVALLSWLLGGQAPRLRDLAVGVVAAVGVSLVVLRSDARIDAVGLLCAAAANASFALGVVLTKRSAPPVNRLADTGWQLALSGLVLVPLALAVEGAPPPLGLRELVGFAYLGVAATGVAFVLWFEGIRRLPAAAPPLLGLAAPVTGAAMGWALLDEALSAAQLAGFSLTLAAIAYGACLAPAPRAALPAPGAARAPGTWSPCHR